MANIRVALNELFRHVLVCTLDSGTEFEVTVDKKKVIHYPMLYDCTPESARLVAEALLVAARLVDNERTPYVGRNVRVLANDHPLRKKAAGKTGTIVGIRESDDGRKIFDIEMKDAFRRPVGFFIDEIMLIDETHAE